MSMSTAEKVFFDFRQLPSEERAKFFELLGEMSGHDRNFTHEEIFGHLAAEGFSSTDAADYLEVSMSTFRRYVRDGKIKVVSEIGRNKLFASKDLKAFKKSLQDVRGAQ